MVFLAIRFEGLASYSWTKRALNIKIEEGSLLLSGLITGMTESSPPPVIPHLLMLELKLELVMETPEPIPTLTNRLVLDPKELKASVALSQAANSVCLPFYVCEVMFRQRYHEQARQAHSNVGPLRDQCPSVSASNVRATSIFGGMTATLPLLE